MKSQESRQQLIGRLFPQGIPMLWCPPLTHFAKKGCFDRDRIVLHLKTLAPHAKGLLVPGSTGEGWEMSEGEIRQLLAIVLEAAQNLGLHVLVGVLKFEVAQVIAAVNDTVGWLRDRTGRPNSLEAMTHSNIVGFTVCPPKGRDLSQDQIADALAEVLRLGHPTALYQLPQVTQNEVSPKAAAHLAATHSNFYLLKDTSGRDRVATSGSDLGGVFLVRGAEGQYCRWLKSAGGPYDGFLLSTANCFARELAEIQNLLKQNRGNEALRLSERIEAVVSRCFDLVRDFPAGNPFTNANKLLDHIFAHGDAALNRVPPLLYSGVHLPAQMIATAFDLLREHGLLPACGYVS